MTWQRGLQDIPQVIKQCKAPGPLSFTALSEEELRLLNNLMGRLYQLAEAAAAVGTSITCLAPVHQPQSSSALPLDCP